MSKLIAVERNTSVCGRYFPDAGRTLFERKPALPGGHRQLHRSSEHDRLMCTASKGGLFSIVISFHLLTVEAIVDDILTVSKLDSNLLKITPVAVKPVEIAKRAVKMFDAELQSKKLQVVFEAHSSLQELKVEWMILDPSRVLQILVCIPITISKTRSNSFADQLDDKRNQIHSHVR